MLDQILYMLIPLPVRRIKWAMLFHFTAIYMCVIWRVYRAYIIVPFVFLLGPCGSVVCGYFGYLSGFVTVLYL